MFIDLGTVQGLSTTRRATLAHRHGEGSGVAPMSWDRIWNVTCDCRGCSGCSPYFGSTSSLAWLSWLSENPLESGHECGHVTSFSGNKSDTIEQIRQEGWGVTANLPRCPTCKGKRQKKAGED